MFCVAAFIILAILGIFSVRYRRLAADAWKCVARKTTFRKCDTSFKEDLKARLLGKLILKRPRLARFLDKWLDVLAFVFVLLTIWSAAITLKSGLNLFVYNTCNPDKPESCSLGAEACSIDTVEPSLWQSAKGGHLVSWAHRQTDQFGETLNRLPDRLKYWNPREYTSGTNSYYHHYDAGKPTALEVIDPGCRFCAQLFRNIQQAGTENRYNLTYIPYPIPDARNQGKYKFTHSRLVASYLEAIRLQPLKNASIPADWQLLQRIFTWEEPATGIDYQSEINYQFNDAQVEALLQNWLRSMGYTQEQVQSIAQSAKSQTVKDNLARERKIVETRIKTVKIPTLLLGSRRYDGVVSADKLK